MSFLDEKIHSMQKFPEGPFFRLLEVPLQEALVRLFLCDDTLHALGSYVPMKRDLNRMCCIVDVCVLCLFLTVSLVCLMCVICGICWSYSLSFKAEIIIYHVLSCQPRMTVTPCLFTKFSGT